MSDAFQIHCGACDHMDTFEAFDTGINGLWRCPKCGKESGRLAPDRMSPEAKALFDKCRTSAEDFRSTLKCSRSNGRPVSPEAALEVLRRVDAGVITMGKTMRGIIETEGRKTFLEQVKTQRIEEKLLRAILTGEKKIDVLTACFEANYATLRKALYTAGRGTRIEVTRAIAAVGKQMFPLVKW